MAEILIITIIIIQHHRRMMEDPPMDQGSQLAPFCVFSSVLWWSKVPFPDRLEVQPLKLLDPDPSALDHTKLPFVFKMRYFDQLFSSPGRGV